MRRIAGVIHRIPDVTRCNLSVMRGVSGVTCGIRSVVRPIPGTLCRMSPIFPQAPVPLQIILAKSTSNIIQYSTGCETGWTIHHSWSYDLRMRSPPSPPRRSSGHQVVYLKCLRCGHEGRVPPERLQEAATKGRRLSCRKCRGYAFQTTVVWHGGPPPDNIVPMKKGSAKRKPVR